ncbi:MAG: hypothetical protein ABSG86_11715 [Thermoguttaceae bacterium]|jgi:hypothetical protein
MRRASWMAVLGGMWILVGQAVAWEPGAGMPGCPCRLGALCAPPCGGPPGYTLGPGCCDHPAGCCDHVWDGYCQEKARRLARWSHAGACRAGTAPPACLPCSAAGQPAQY